MKIKFGLCLCLCLIQIKIISFGQESTSLLEKQITITKTSGTVQDVLNALQTEGGFTFSFSTNELPLKKNVNNHVKEQNLQEHLDQLLGKGEYIYYEGQNKIIIKRKVTSPKQKEKYTIKGYINDAENSESLIGANILDSKTMQGTTSNVYGFYSLTLSSDTVMLVFSYVGYKAEAVKFYLRQDTTINISLESFTQLQEVVVTAERPIEEQTQMSKIDVPIAQIKSMPALLGEVDVLKVLQLLPGVQSGAEGSSGLYVRGGGPDQNLILLDGVPVYNASHLFGFFSVFNADAINKVELIKGGFPARYGGRLSSVIDISMKEGNMKEFHGEGGIGLISSRLTLEGPIKKDKASFIISGRRTYLDVVARPIIKAKTDGDEVVGYYFYDLNGKINYKFSDKDRIYLSAYLGDDRFYSKNKSDYSSNNNYYESNDRAGLNWGNITSALRWNHIVNNKLFSNTTFTYSRYRFNIYEQTHDIALEEGKRRETQYYTEYRSGIRDLSLKIDFDYLPTPDHFVKIGANAIHHRFDPGAFAFNAFVSGDTLVGAEPTFALEHAMYVEDDYKVNEKLKVNAGLHFSGFAVDGKYYNSLQPRASLRYFIKPDLSAKLSYARMAQFIHLLTNSGIGLPTDLWVPATDRVRPQRSSQVTLGFAKTFSNRYEVSLEGYYKKMTNLIEYKEGATFLNLDKNWENKITTGEGWSYGLEAFAQKKLGKTTGWVGYTLAWTNRKFPELNFGEIYPYKYDRRHDVSIAVVHKFNEKVELSGAWVYGTGTAITIPVATYPYMGDGVNQQSPESFFYQRVPIHSKRNEYRMPAYHRLDASLSLFKKTKWGERRWVFGVYNLYNRRNPFYIDIANDEENGNKPVFKQYSIFQLVPSISYNFKF